MNTLKIVLPYSYAKNLVNLTWEDILYAINNGFFNPEAAVEHAVHILGEEEQSSQVIVDLACAEKGDPIDIYLGKLVNTVTEQDNMLSRMKLLYLLLNWVYEHKEIYSDPLEMVEIIYSDFDYPEEISGFVRYMPASDPILDSLELNRERLYIKWREYLDKQRSGNSL